MKQLYNFFFVLRIYLSINKKRHSNDIYDDDEELSDLKKSQKNPNMYCIAEQMALTSCTNNDNLEKCSFFKQLTLISSSSSQCNHKENHPIAETYFVKTKKTQIAPLILHDQFVYALENFKIYCPETDQIYDFKNCSYFNLFKGENSQIVGYKDLSESSFLSQIIIYLKNSFASTVIDEMRYNRIEERLNLAINYAIILFTGFSIQTMEICSIINKKTIKLNNNYFFEFKKIFSWFDDEIDNISIKSIDEMKKIINKYRMYLHLYEEKIYEINIKIKNHSREIEIDSIFFSILEQNTACYICKSIVLLEIKNLKVKEITNLKFLEIKFISHVIHSLSRKAKQYFFIEDINNEKIVDRLINYEFLKFRHFMKRLLFSLLVMSFGNDKKILNFSRFLYAEGLLIYFQKSINKGKIGKNIFFIAEIFDLMSFSHLNDNTHTFYEIFDLLKNFFYVYNEEAKNNNITVTLYKKNIKIWINKLSIILAKKKYYFKYLTKEHKIVLEKVKKKQITIVKEDLMIDLEIFKCYEEIYYLLLYYLSRKSKD